MTGVLIIGAVVLVAARPMWSDTPAPNLITLVTSAIAADLLMDAGRGWFAHAERATNLPGWWWWLALTLALAYGPGWLHRAGCALRRRYARRRTAETARTN
jgi:hypothetical protein